VLHFLGFPVYYAEILDALYLLTAYGRMLENTHFIPCALEEFSFRVFSATDTDVVY